ncbi:perosamine synthetase [Evansella caseinilytica]|uniref:Perosamine synthetase n=1 Tax=Evansella caseinilytica TaxID=1503961 RepID=A0A1H3HQP5_9BACI|nr:LegC family aminotransferase [Evansella caseinilytica]SDY17846.1 perosamine synthetase [Evansella caseinilytica]
MKDTADYADNMIAAVRKAASASRTQAILPLHEPVFQGNEWKYVKACLDSTFVSSVGEYVTRFEKALAEYVGVKRAVAVASGTAALHVALRLVGVEKNDEVLLPGLTFVATANAVAYCGAVPHFVDSDETTLGLAPCQLKEYLRDTAIVKQQQCFNSKTGRRIKAAVPVHTFGHPVDIAPLLDLCRMYHIELVEDAAEALGSLYKGKHAGSFGRVSAISFNGNKIITAGGGGAILTDDEELADRARHITTTAKLPHPWEYVHDDIGYNYRMPNLNAALVLAQLEQLPAFLAKKRKLAEAYAKAFKPLEGVRLFTEPAFARSNYWLQTLLLEEGTEGKRDQLLTALHEANILARPAWKPLHQLDMYQQCPRMEMKNAEKLTAAIINLPSGAAL